MELLSKYVLFSHFRQHDGTPENKMKRSIISGNRNRFSLYPYEEGDGKGERGEG